MGQALDRFDDETVNLRPHGAGTNSAAALIVHACSSARYRFEHIGLGRHLDRDRVAELTASSTVAEFRALHVLEELFQHLGHLELTADAVGSTAR